MISLLEEKYLLRSKKLNKIEKLKEGIDPLDSLKNLENLELNDADRSFFLKCFGCYYKEKTNDYMIKLRVTGAKLTALQAKTIGQIAQKYGNDYIDLTTRAQLELRYIKEERLYEVLNLLDSVGLSSYQTGVDNFRGIVVDPLSTLSRSSILDDRALTTQLEALFVKKEDQIAKIPRKFNIGICGNYKNTANIFTHDLAFALAKKDGEYGYNIYLGGRVGVIATSGNVFVNDQEAVVFFQGVKELFQKYGFRDNRNKNRFHFLLKEVGISNFIKAVEEFTKYNFRNSGELLTSTKTDTALIEELQNGKKAYKFIVPSGIFSGTALIEASKLALKYDGNIALTIDQNFYITNSDESITQSELYKRGETL